MPNGFEVNNFDHLDNAKEDEHEHTREANGWGLVRDDFIKYKVRLVTDIRFIWDESTPPEMRKALAEAGHVVHHIAEKQIMFQLEHDGLKPVETRNVLYGNSLDNNEPIILRDTGWESL